MEEFSRDIGSPFRYILDIPDQLRYGLKRWGRLSEEDLTEMVSWTGTRVGDVKLAFRNETYGSRSLRSPIVRGCPVCLQEDLAETGGLAPSLMALRGDWQYRDCVICIRHEHPLIPLWQEDGVMERFDSASQFALLKSQIVSHDLQVPRGIPTAYDFWLDARFEGVKGRDWLATLPTEAVTTVGRLLGTHICGYMPSDVKDDVTLLSQALNAGFSVLAKGPEAYRAKLDELAERADGALAEPKQAFGVLYSRLANEALDIPGFDTFRSIMRDCIIENWPLPTGTMVLGEPLAERYLHSVWTVAAEAKMPPLKMESLLIQAGAILEGDIRPRNRKVFRAADYAELIAEMPYLVGEREVRLKFGANKREFNALVAAGILKPRFEKKGHRVLWNISDCLAQLNNLQAKAPKTVLEADPEWDTMLRISSKQSVTLQKVFEAALSGSLTIAMTAGQEGFHAIRVKKDSLREWMSNESHPSRIQSLTGSVSLSEFGRRAGIRNPVHLAALVEAGLIEVYEVRHPVTARLQIRISDDSAAMFCATYATIGTLSEEYGLSPNVVRARLAGAELPRVALDVTHAAPIWRRDEALTLFTSDL